MGGDLRFLHPGFPRRVDRRAACGYPFIVPPFDGQILQSAPRSATDRLRGVVIALTLGLCLGGTGGCLWKRETRRPVEQFGTIQAVYRFRNVRSTEFGDEWAQIQQALAGALSGETRTAMSARAAAAQPKAERVVAGITLRDYEVAVRLPSHLDALAIQKRLDGLAAQPSLATGEPMGYVGMGEQVTATYEYLTSYSVAGVRVLVEGQTVPGSAVTLYVPEGEDSFETEDGIWERQVRVMQGQQWIYGVATPRRGPARWFRIDIAAGTTQAIWSKEEFDRLRLSPDRSGGRQPAAGSR